ncbi:MAG TPA: ABC transporter substrate-binding protein [Thermomicrobiales bacterium]|jgi:peptide/nickel transport system substrate-binding protein|nr:ABC transporter substrate-binding protein [Thermomicrobiales bacterium]
MTDFSSGASLAQTPLHRRELMRLITGGAALAGAIAISPSVLARQGTPGGTVTIVTAANPASWDLTNATWPTWEGVNFLYDRLLSFDDTETLQPALATAWEVSADGLQYKLTLREGVTFHDGTPFNAEAVRFNVQRHIDKPDSTYYTVYEPVERVDVVDDLTAVIVLREVRPNFAYEGLADWGAMQVSPTAYTALGDRFGEGPVGTGPFKFGSYEAGASITYTRNEAYWGGAPMLDSVRVRIIPESAVALVEMEAGTVDAVLVEPKDVQAMTDLGLVIEQQVSPGAELMSINLSQSPTDELLVRQALALAIDRDAIIESVLFGFAEKSNGGVTSASPFYNADIPLIEYDPERAGELLDQAGWVMGDGGIRQRDGQPLKLNLLSTDFADWGLFNQIFQEQLRQVGIDIEITSLEWNAMLDQWRQNQGNWNISYHQQGSTMASTSPIQASWAPTDYWNINQIDDATATDLVPVRDELQALSDEFQTASDPARRLEIAKRAQTLYYEHQLVAWMWHRSTVHAIQPRLQGYRLTYAGRIVELDKAYVS